MKKEPKVIYSGISEGNRGLAEALTKEEIAEVFEEYDFQLKKDACLVDFIRSYLDSVDDLERLKNLISHVIDCYNNTYLIVIKKGDVNNG